MIKNFSNYLHNAMEHSDSLAIQRHLGEFLIVININTTHEHNATDDEMRKQETHRGES